VKSTLTAAASGLILLSAAGAARAADPVTFFGYNLNASIDAEYSPTYEGGKRYTVFPGGSLAVTKPWEFDAFTSPDDAASIAILNTRRFSFGAAASVRENRGDDEELLGMRNIGWSISGGGFMNVWPTHWMRIHVEGLKGLTAQSGIVVNSGIDFVSHPKYWNLAIGPRYSWGDDHFNGTYFGVTPAEAAASPYIQNPYQARASPGSRPAPNTNGARVGGSPSKQATPDCWVTTPPAPWSASWARSTSSPSPPACASCSASLKPRPAGPPSRAVTGPARPRPGVGRAYPTRL